MEKKKSFYTASDCLVQGVKKWHSQSEWSGFIFKKYSLLRTLAQYYLQDYLPFEAIPSLRH